MDRVDGIYQVHTHTQNKLRIKISTAYMHQHIQQDPLTWYSLCFIIIIQWGRAVDYFISVISDHPQFYNDYIENSTRHKIIEKKQALSKNKTMNIHESCPSKWHESLHIFEQDTHRSGPSLPEVVVCYALTKHQKQGSLAGHRMGPSPPNHLWKPWSSGSSA